MSLGRRAERLFRVVTSCHDFCPALLHSPVLEGGAAGGQAVVKRGQGVSVSQVAN